MPHGGQGHAAAGKTAALSKKGLGALRNVKPSFQLPPLGSDGKIAGADLPRRAPAGHRPAGPGRRGIAGMPNSGSNMPVAPLRPATGITPKIPANTVAPSFDGAHESNCGTCIPSDSNSAVGQSQIVEVVNLEILVFDKSGTLQCAGTMNNFLGTSDSLSDPRVQYDAINDRFSMSITVVAASASATPALWVAASTSGNPCNGFFVFRVTFGGTGYPAGTTLDYPYLGQDAGALMLSSDNFCCRAGNSIGGGVGTFAFTIPKSAVYNDQGFSFGSTQVDAHTAPVSAADIPGQSTTSSYWLASLPGTGYDLFRMPVGGGPITLQARISAPFSAPTRLVNQPGTSVTLDPLDGRIQWSPVQVGSVIWFAHGIDDSGFPTVRYGEVNAADNSINTAEAFHAGDSDDFDPSIGVEPDGPGSSLVWVWVNWSYTQSNEGVAASDTVNGGFMGVPGGLIGPLPFLTGTDLTLVNGSVTNQVDTNKGPTFGRFGDYSSVSVDPVPTTAGCPAPAPGGSVVPFTAVTDQQYFDTTGNWVTRVGRTTFCDVISPIG
jgi:hypothetical protein